MNKQIPREGKVYELLHERFGRATVKVLSTDETWAECKIISGILRGMGRGAFWEPRDTKIVRIEHGIWEEVK